MSNLSKIIDVFTEAKTRPTEADRENFVCEACADDPELKQQVESLLNANDRSADFLQPAMLKTQVLITQKVGDQIGRYRLIDKIGEGGCGVVYKAEQREPVRRCVALKVIKLGMDTREVIARFEAERQALALMDHPNIARVLDAGATEKGRPYFVMELVSGIKLTEHCDQNALTIDQRLKLFTQVCQAIQHAHQKGIIHRDIKPSNILVTQHDDTAVPKVIDFGIAKATTMQLTQKTLFTDIMQFVGTPAYMSPEQAGMKCLDIDTRSDIYSLGVLLYELLTGHTPFPAKKLMAVGMDEMRRIIREDEPTRPSVCLGNMNDADLKKVAGRRHVDSSKLSHAVRGDLDWIVMRCLEKDRTRRYQTANALAMDVQRHLNHEPVVARPPSRSYRFQKLVRRNRLTVSAASAVIIASFVGLGVSTWMFLKEKEAHERAAAAERSARIEAAKSREVATFLKNMLKGIRPAVASGRDTEMLREIVDRTADRISQDLKGQPEVEIDLRLSVAQIYLDLTLYKKVEEMATKTLQLARTNFGDENWMVADALTQLGRALFFSRSNGVDHAERVTRQALAMQRKLRGEGSLQEADALISLADILHHQFKTYGKKETIQDAESAARRAVEIRRKLFGNTDDQVAWALHPLFLVLRSQDKWTEASTVAHQMLSIRERTYGADHVFTAEADFLMGQSLLHSQPSPSQKEIDEAEAWYRKGIVLLKTLAPSGRWHDAWAFNGFASVLFRQGKFEEAEMNWWSAYDIAKKQMGETHRDIAFFATQLANILRKNGKPAEARAVAEEAVRVCQQHPNGVQRSVRENAFNALEAVLMEMNDEAGLIAFYTERSKWFEAREIN